MLIIGLTGGIGSGKSTVAGYFSRLGVPVIDADLIARELVAPGSPAAEKIAGIFGPSVLLTDGSLDRPQLRHLVFTDSNARRRLEAVLHPLIYAEMRLRTRALRTRYCVWVVPLLLETCKTELVDRVLVVDTAESLQRQRALSRDGMDDDILEAILTSQVSRAERLRAADDVIVNNADLTHLQEQVAALHHHYLDLANAVSVPPKNA